jgi:hypothetical protein
MAPRETLLIFAVICVACWPSYGWLSCQSRSAGLFQISNSNGAIYAYCDGSNNILIQQSQSDGCPTYVGVNSLTPSTCGYVPESSVRNIAQLSTTVTLYSRGMFAVNSDGCAITSLRTSTTWQYASCTFSGTWIWMFMQSQNTCPQFPLIGDAWPNMYWGCGYAETVHWVVNIVHHKNVAVDLASLDSYTKLQMGTPCGVGTIGFPISTCRQCTIASDCSSHTISVSDDGFRELCVCVCEPGYTGRTCSARGACTMSLDCDGAHTSSVSGNYPSCTCSCNYRYTGPRCSTPDVCTNSQDCSGHAASVTGSYPNCGCTCVPAYTGSACQLRYCVKSIDCTDARTRYVTGTFPGCVCNCVLGYGGATCKRTLTKSYSITVSATPDLTATDTVTAAWSFTESMSPAPSTTRTMSHSPLSPSALASGSLTLSPAPSATASATFSPELTLTTSPTALVSRTSSVSATRTMTPSLTMTTSPSRNDSATWSASPSQSASQTQSPTMSSTHTPSRGTGTFVLSLTQTIRLSLSPSATQPQSATKTITLPRTPTATVSWSSSSEASASRGSVTATFSFSASGTDTGRSPSHSSASMTATACLGIADPVAVVPLGSVGGVLPVGIQPRANCDTPTAAGGAANFQIPRRMSRNGRPLCLMVNNVPLAFYLHLPYPPLITQELHLDINLLLENTTTLGNGTVVSGDVWPYLHLPVKPFMIFKQAPPIEPSSPAPTELHNGSSSANNTNTSDPIPWIPIGASAYRTTIFVACAAIHDPVELVLVYEPTSVTTIDTVSTAVSIVTVILGGNAAMGISIPLFAALTCDGGEVVAPVSQLSMRMISLFYDVSNVAVVFGNLALCVAVLLMFAAASMMYFKRAPSRGAGSARLDRDDSLGNGAGDALGSSSSSTNDDDLEISTTVRRQRYELDVKWLASCAACRFPSWPMVLVEFLMPGVVFGSMLMMVSLDTTGGEYVAAFFGLLISAAFPVAYHVGIDRLVLPRASWGMWPPVDDPLHPAFGRGWLLAIFPTHQWRSTDLRNACNSMICAMKPSTAAMWRPAEVAMTLLPGIGAALSSGSLSVSVYSCLSVGFVISAIYIIFALLLVIFSPYRMPLDRLVGPSTYAILGVSLLIKMTSAVLARRPAGDESTEASLTLAAAVLQIILVISQLSRSAANLYIIWVEGQIATTTEVDEELTEKINQVDDQQDPTSEAIELVIDDSDEEYADNDDVLQFTSVVEAEEPEAYFGISGYFAAQDETSHVSQLML